MGHHVREGKYAFEPCPGQVEGTVSTVTHTLETASNRGASEVLDRIGSKWAVHVVQLLGMRPLRFTDLRRGIDGISQRMLTVTLRGLERDGLVTRTVYAVVPPRVEYALTPLGSTLVPAVRALLQWADEHVSQIAAARVAYDGRPSDLPFQTDAQAHLARGIEHPGASSPGPHGA
jgi:DNA-binding HxlR family transcriptional regulator